MTMQHLVCIRTGEARDLYVTEWGTVYRKDQLKKDGTPNANARPSGLLYPDPVYLARGPGLTSFVAFDPVREQRAQDLRERIFQYEEKIRATQEALLALYRKEA